MGLSGARFVLEANGEVGLVRGIKGASRRAASDHAEVGRELGSPVNRVNVVVDCASAASTAGWRTREGFAGFVNGLDCAVGVRKEESGRPLRT